MDFTTLAPLIENFSLTSALIIAVIYFYQRTQELKKQYQDITKKHELLAQDYSKLLIKVNTLETKESLSSALIERIDKIEKAINNLN